MTNYRSLNHSKWACQYHVVFIWACPDLVDGLALSVTS